jgi:hypothetical protein
MSRVVRRATALTRATTLTFVIPTEAEGSAVPSVHITKPGVHFRASQPVNRTNCSASSLGPKIETLGICPRAIATSSQR